MKFRKVGLSRCHDFLHVQGDRKTVYELHATLIPHGIIVVVVNSEWFGRNIHSTKEVARASM